IGGVTPWHFSPLSPLPSGLALADDGAIAGTPDAPGVFTFSAKVVDSGPPVQTQTKDFTITVIASNQAPSFTKGPDQTVIEDSGSKIVPNWATNFSPGPPNESAQKLKAYHI